MDRSYAEAALAFGILMPHYDDSRSGYCAHVTLTKPVRLRQYPFQHRVNFRIFVGHRTALDDTSQPSYPPNGHLLGCHCRSSGSASTIC